MTEPLAPADVEAAAERIAGRIHTTPILRSRTLDAWAGARLHLKAECFQRTGSFKIRGAFNALLQMTGAERGPGVVTVSSGNHAQAVALAASELGTRAVVVVPEDANPVKVEAARAYGAEVVATGVTAENREAFVREVAADRGLHLVHPFDDPRIMAGQGTLGLELAAQAPRLDAVVVPCGGGGLLSGVACAMKDRSPDTRVVAVEPEAAADLVASLGAGRRIPLERAPDTICDGVRSLCVGEHPWAVIRRLVDDAVAVTDDQVREAMRLLWTRAKIVVEPSGALALAAVLAGKVSGEEVGVVCSGGNVSP